VEQGDVLALTSVELAQLGGRMVADQALPVGRAIQHVVVDDHQPAVGRKVDVAFDQVAPRLDRRAERTHGVLRVVRGVSAVPAQQRAAFVVRGLVAGANRLSQARASLTPRADGSLVEAAAILLYSAD